MQQKVRKVQPGPRQLELLDYLERRGGRAHGLVRTGRAIGPNGSGYYGVRAIRRAEARGLVRVEACVHGVLQALDVVLDERDPEERERDLRAVRERRALVAFFEQAGGRVHEPTGWPRWLEQYVGFNWRDTFERAVSDGLLRIEPCVHGDPRAWDAVLMKKP